MSHTPSKKKGGGKHHIKFAPTLFFEGVYQQAAFIFPPASLCPIAFANASSAVRVASWMLNVTCMASLPLFSVLSITSAHAVDRSVKAIASTQPPHIFFGSTTVHENPLTFQKVTN